MRGILFRGKHISSFPEDQEKWMYGYYQDEKSIECDFPCIIPLLDSYIPMDYAVYPETVGQYTGLKDKNGKKIFEGDILEDCVGDKFYVYWNEDDCQYCKSSIGDGTPIETSFDWFDADNTEVIGNIYDNPELLEEEHASD